MTTWDVSENSSEDVFISVLLMDSFSKMIGNGSVLSESSPKEVLLPFLVEHLAQPGRTCLSCLTPECDKVLVSLAYTVCLDQLGNVAMAVVSLSFNF